MHTDNYMEKKMAVRLLQLLEFAQYVLTIKHLFNIINLQSNRLIDFHNYTDLFCL